MKAIFKGHITFGQVTIPIKLFSAVKSHGGLSFTLLHKKCKHPVKYQRFCTKCKKNIEWKDIVKGILMPDETYLVFTEEQFEKLKPEPTDDLEIVECVSKDAIPAIYYSAHYFISPLKVTDKAYFLLQDVLKSSKKVAIAQFVIREKEHLCVIQPYEHGLLLSLLYYEYEIRDLTKIEQLAVTVEPKISANEKKLAQRLVDRLTVKKFDASKFRDNYTQTLLEQIEKKSKGKKIIERKKAKPKKAKTVSLVDSLKESLDELGTSRKTGTRVSARKGR